MARIVKQHAFCRPWDDTAALWGGGAVAVILLWVFFLVGWKVIEWPPDGMVKVAMAALYVVTALFFSLLGMGMGTVWLCDKPTHMKVADRLEGV